jgi:hypothetical protein
MRSPRFPDEVSAVYHRHAPFRCVLMCAALACPSVLAAQSQGPTVALTVDRGRPLHVALDARTRVKQVGQAVAGTLVDPVYAYDRIVIPAGTAVRGHVVQLVEPSRWARIRAMSTGDFSPHRRVVLQFDVLVLDTGETPIETVVTNEIARPARTSAPAERNADAAPSGNVAHDWSRRLVADAKAREHAALNEVRAPDKLARLEAVAIEQLPYHPQYLTKGAVYTAQLSSPVDFGSAVPLSLAGASAPQPGSVLTAQLLTHINSRTSARGTPIEAVVTEPVLSQDHQLILAEGTRLTGQVTWTKGARWFHHNGQLRFLFERVQAPGQTSEPLLASLHAAQTSADDRVRIDEEGGTSISNSKTRFIAPALALLSLRRGLDHGDHDSDSNLSGSGSSGKARGTGLGGLIGLRFTGLVLGRASQPVGIALTVWGASRTIYTNILSRGKEVDFPSDTPIQLQLAPARAK